MVKKLLTMIFGLSLAFGAMAQWGEGNPTVPQSDILFWTGTGTNRAVIAITWEDDNEEFIGIAWGVQWNGTTIMLKSLMDTIAAYDSRVTLSSSATFITNIAYNDSELGLNLIGEDSWWWYNWKNASDQLQSSSGITYDMIQNGDFVDWMQMGPADNMIMATDPNGSSEPTVVEATIDFADILYWVGEGSNEAVLAVNWADTALAWGYRWNGTATVSTMMAAIAAADPRFSYTGEGWLDDILFNDGTVSLAGTPGNYWGSTNNGVMDAGMGQTLSDGDFEKWGDPAAGVVVDSNNYGGPIWYYTYAYPMTVYPVSEPSTDPVEPVVEATIDFADILYWVGEGSNEAVLAVNWADTALAWGYRWNGSATVSTMMADIAAADPRFSYTGESWLDDIHFNDGTVSLAGTPGNYWGSTNNGVMDAGMGQTLSDGDFEKWGDPAAGVVIDSNNYGGPIWYYTYAYPMTVHPVSVPGTTPEVVEATIDFSLIEYWVGEGSNEAVMVINWADTALAWGYRWNGTATVATMMADIAEADSRFSYDGTGFVNDILFNDGNVSLAGTPGNYWGSTNNGVMDMGMGQTLNNGDLEKWGDPAAGVVVDSNNYGGPVWYYTYAYPMTIHAVSQPFGAGPFCGIVGTEGCTAVAANDPAILGWAIGCTLNLGPQNISVEGSPLVSYHTAEDAIGPCSMNDNLSVVSLGDGGSATLTFARPIKNGPGFDFAVFENSFDDYFLELAFVEVSTDGEHFVRIPSTSLIQTARQLAGNVDATYINNLAGKYRTGYGTPFDLEEVRDSTGINIDSINYVRVVDVVGSINPLYATYDAFGHIVNDPWPTNSYSSGFDLDGVAVLHQEGEGIAEADMLVQAVYPNPVTSRVNVICTRNIDGAVVYDQSGRIVAILNLHEGINTVDLSRLAAGIYMLRAEGNATKIVKR